MCLYCQNHSKDYSEHVILSQQKSLGALGTCYAECSMLPRTNKLNISFITDYSVVFDEAVAINYCPMCGRRLSNSDSV